MKELVRLLALFTAFVFAICDPVARFPLQFTANITLTAHLIEHESEYPPRVRHMAIAYDYPGKRARADIEAGYEAAKVYIRRYDTNQEYMIRLPPIDDCKRAYLGEEMPFPDIEDNSFIRTEVVDGQECHYFLHEAFETRVHMYFKVSDGTPFKLIHESTEGGVSTPLLTYEYSNVVLGEPQLSLFDIPSPHVHEKCTRHVGGFPYLHVFHYFAKF